MEFNNTQHKSSLCHLISHCVLRPVSGREHHVSDYLLAGIEGCGYKDRTCLFIAYHDDSGWCGCSCNHGAYSGYYGQYGDCLSYTAGMLWGYWNVCTFESLCFFFCKEVVFCPTCPSPGGGSLTHSQTLRCSEPLRYKVGGPS